MTMREPQGAARMGSQMLNEIKLGVATARPKGDA